MATPSSTILSPAAMASNAAPATATGTASDPLIVYVANQPKPVPIPLPPGASASQPMIIQVASIPSVGTPDPHWTAYWQAIGTPVVAVVAALFATYFAWRQWRTAQNKLNFDLFQRRIVAYQEARLMVLRVAKVQHVYAEHLVAFDEAVQGAQWLFDTKVASELALLRESAFYMSGLSPVMSVADAQPAKTLTGQIAKLQALHHDVEELDDLNALFDPFMKLYSDGFWRSLVGRFKKSRDRSQITLASAEYLNALNPQFREEEPDPT